MFDSSAFLMLTSSAALNPNVNQVKNNINKSKKSKPAMKNILGWEDDLSFGPLYLETSQRIPLPKNENTGCLVKKVLLFFFCFFLFFFFKSTFYLSNQYYQITLTYQKIPLTYKYL